MLTTRKTSNMNDFMINDGVLVGYTGKSLNPVLPEGIEIIGKDAFEFLEIQSVTLSQGVKVIASGAFVYCEKLKRISFPDTLEVIDKFAFCGCKSLKEVVLPKSVRFIHILAFDECPNIKSIEVARDNPEYSSIDGVLFDKEVKQLIYYPRAKKGRAYTIPEGVEKIVINAFGNNENLQEVILPDSLKNMKDTFYSKTNIKAFYINESNEALCSEDGMVLSKDKKELIIYPCKCEYTVPDGVEKIGFTAFINNEELDYMVLPDSVEVLDESAFQGCKFMENISLPENLKYIGKSAFEGCSLLKELEMPDNVEYIGNSAFMNCTSLTNAILPVNLKTLGSGAFYGCNSIRIAYITDNITKIEGGTFFNCFDLELVSLPETVSEIGPYAFANCDMLRFIEIRTKDKKYSFEIKVLRQKLKDRGHDVEAEVICDKIKDNVSKLLKTVLKLKDYDTY